MGGRVVSVFVLLTAIFYRPCDGDQGSDSLVVQTFTGPIKGHSFVSSWTNQAVYAFQGIPYAAPPVGNLRFKDPIPPQKWTSLKDCTKEQDSCMQNVDPVLAKLNLSFSMSENCLFLSVYTPKLKPETALPVMVWVHGGAYLEGSGSYFRYGPDVLVAEGVIVVTLNYRLGVFGFLTLGTPEIPGNVALKDQRLALQWVQKEISNFGGDPGKVTLFGESAGSACVHLHYLSPLSKGLFHRVIGESGTSLGWAVRANGTAYGLQLASVLNCTSASIPATQQCLLAASAVDIVKAQGLVEPTENDTQDTLTLIFIPSVDKTSSKEPFLTDMPKEMMKQKLGSFVPFLMGMNAHEGIMMLYKGDDAINNITNNLANFIPREVRDVSVPSRIQVLVERIQNFYFKESKTLSEKIKGFIELYTDVMFGYNTAISAKAFKQRGPVYLYSFEFDGLFKEIPSKLIEQKYNITGVSHAEEMSYLFVRKKVNQTAAADSREIKTWKRMARMWTNFAKFGTPTVEPDLLLQNVSWLPVGQVATRYLRISDNLTMVAEDFLGPCVALWDNITPSSGYLSLQVAGTVALASAAVYAAF